MPITYNKKRKAMLEAIKEQYTGPPLEGPLRVEIHIQGEGRGDADNIIGALLDCANGVLWVDDRVSVIPQIEVKWVKAKRENSLWAIAIFQLEEADMIRCKETLLDLLDVF